MIIYLRFKVYFLEFINNFIFQNGKGLVVMIRVYNNIKVVRVVVK